MILIEVRVPHTKEESEVYGETFADESASVVKIFINSKKNKNRFEFVNTLMHELFHAVVYLFYDRLPIKMSIKAEEKIANDIGDKVEDLLDVI